MTKRWLGAIGFTQISALSEERIIFSATNSRGEQVDSILNTTSAKFRLLVHVKLMQNGAENGT